MQNFFSHKKFCAMKIFMEKNGMKNVSDTSWASGTIPGVVYKFDSET